MFRNRVSLTGLLQAAAILTLVFSLLTSVPSLHHHVELFSHFRLQYLAVSALLLLVFAALRSPAYSIVLLGTVALNASYVVPWYLGHGKTDTPANAVSVKLLSANVLSRNEEYDRLIELINDEQPDIIFLQEISPRWLVALEPVRADYPYSYAEPRYDNFGIAMYSRRPLDSVIHVATPPLDYPTIIATLTVNGAPLTLINTHPTIPLTRSGFEARNLQLQNIAEIVTATQGNVILSGDLNTTLWSPAYRMLEESTGLKNARQGAGIVPTWPTFIPFAMIPIDHVLVSKDIRVVGIERRRLSGSDHLSLLVTVAL